MLTADEALTKIFDHVHPIGIERVALSEAIDRTLAADLTARYDLPPFDNSAMDGFAVSDSDVLPASQETPVVLRVSQQIRAGDLSNIAVKPGNAVMIMTGAPLPQGATAVVMKEATSMNGSGTVTVYHSASAGENIRRQGEDIRRGAPLLKAGVRLRPYEIALLAAQGFSTVPVVRKPMVGVLATGDELVPVKKKLSRGKIYNSNGPAVCAALRHWKMDVVDFGIAKDNRRGLKKKIARALKKTDVLLVSGGVSVGDFDYTKSTLEALGVREVFWKVAIKPGKPLFFGVMKDKYVFGLPGNPISALVCLEEFVRSALERLQGFEARHPSYHLSGKALNDYPLPSGRRQFLFAQARSKGHGFELHIIRPQGSAMMGMAVSANVLALAPEGARKINAGDDIAFRWLK